MTEHGRSEGTSWLYSRKGLVLLGFLAVAGFYLLTEHTAHVFGVLPFLLFALCPADAPVHARWPWWARRRG
jgi:hypothetical protein